METDYYYEQTYEGKKYHRENLAAGEYERCRFQNCSFSHSDLSGRKFIECHFINCSFEGANINDVVFRNILFKTCKLLGLNFEKCEKLLFSMNCEGCQLDFTSFHKMRLKGMTFRDCSFREADFTEADLTGASLKHCDLERAVFKKTVLEKVDFRTSYNFSIDPENNSIKKAKFSLGSVAGLLDRYDIRIE